MIVIGASSFVSTQVGNVDIFVSFRGRDGEWTEAVGMGHGINSEGQDLCPMVTPDGKYLFFLSDRNGNSDVWWVDAVVIDRLRNQVLDPDRWAQARRTDTGQTTEATAGC